MLYGGVGTYQESGTRELGEWFEVCCEEWDLPRLPTVSHFPGKSPKLRPKKKSLSVHTVRWKKEVNRASPICDEEQREEQRITEEERQVAVRITNEKRRLDAEERLSRIQKVLLNISYEHKDMYKMYGTKCDSEAKLWYLQGDINDLPDHLVALKQRWISSPNSSWWEPWTSLYIQNQFYSSMRVCG